MFMHRFETAGLAHWSYYLADGSEAVVIDPQRDVRPHTELARSRGDRIVGVLETHRNEDFVSGTLELAERTGATAWHADGGLDYSYGSPVLPEQRFDFGAYALEAVFTPGHTRGHMCYLVREEGIPWMLFSGDLLFSGSVGRTDLGGPQHAERSARELYHSLHDRVLPLGDHVIVWPAHGAGSACGLEIASRRFTTIGIERATNQMVALDEDAFVQRSRETSAALGKPPYFDRMERDNLRGKRMDERIVLPPLPPERVEGLLAEGAVILDTRPTECYLAAHVCGSVAIPSAMLGAWAGWFVPLDTPIVLVSDDPYADMIEIARLGLEDVRGFLGGGMPAWEVAGRHVRSTHTRHPRRLSPCRH